MWSSANRHRDAIPRPGLRLRRHARAPRARGRRHRSPRWKECAHRARKLVLVTGRQLDDLARSSPQLDLFERVVAENGARALPAGEPRGARAGRAAAARPSSTRCAAGVRPLSVGRVIVATWEPHETTVLETIRDLGLELQVIFNKGAVMVLPAGVNKATGLAAALAELGLSPHNVVGVGDAENDHAFLAAASARSRWPTRCRRSRSAPTVVTQGEARRRRRRADRRAGRRRPARAGEPALDAPRICCSAALPDGERSARWPPLRRHRAASPARRAAASRRSPTGLLERIGGAGISSASSIPRATTKRSPARSRSATASARRASTRCSSCCDDPTQHVIVNLLGLALADRPPFFEALLPRLHAAARAHRPAALDRRRRGAPSAARRLGSPRDAAAGAGRYVADHRASRARGERDSRVGGHRPRRRARPRGDATRGPRRGEGGGDRGGRVGSCRRMKRWRGRRISASRSCASPSCRPTSSSPTLGSS